MMQKTPFWQYISTVVMAFRDDEEVDIDVLLNHLDSFRDQLEAFYDRYSGECPPGAEAFQDLISTGVSHYYNAVDKVEEYCDSVEDSVLEEALEQVDIGEELLSQALSQAQSFSLGGSYL